LVSQNLGENTSYQCSRTGVKKTLEPTWGENNKQIKKTAQTGTSGLVGHVPHIMQRKNTYRMKTQEQMGG
jgi:hypothetical protein